MLLIFILLVQITGVSQEYGGRILEVTEGISGDAQLARRNNTTTSYGGTLLEIKKSFRDVSNVLYDWTDSSSSDYCTWRGVSCDNVSFNVVALNLSDLNLDGDLSPRIGELKGLLSINLRGNRLSGHIPDEIGDCTNLQNLDLSYNMLTGDIPFSISKLKQLELLILKNNQLIGPIPSTLSQIPNLKILDLAQNRLNGEIPSLIYGNQVLQYLGLGSNYLVGELSPDVCQLTGLWYFDVRNNRISGTLPSNLGNCTGLQVLDLSYNRLTGKIPFSIGFLQVATLSLQGNQLSGEIPSVIGLMEALTILDLSCNNLSGQIPPILGNLTYTEKLYLHSNKLTGSIPPELGNLSMLHYLELNHNQLTGHIPPELGKLSNLFNLNVAGNKLEGRIPSDLSSCTNLNGLNVHGNKLKGTIPAEFQTLERMTYLNLSSNNISGPIPIELSRIGNLDTLDLSNNMISGPIPSPLGDLEHLLKMNLSQNELTGYLPAEFGNLRSIMEIDLSYNHLFGILPQELGQLDYLFTLKLESNNLTGGLESLVNCLSLSVLNVSYNNLAGDIPTRNNFSRFSPDSFIANPRLCSSSLNSSHASRSAERAAISKAAILGIAFGLLAFLFIILVAACRLHRSKPFMERSFDRPVHWSPPKLVHFCPKMACLSYDDIMSRTEHLSKKYVIGHGASSTVYKCVFENGLPVAIKQFDTFHPQYLQQFETELETLGRIRHRNLASLLGYCLSTSGNLLFYDYMEEGSLWDLLHGPLQHKLDWKTRIQIALGAAQGLAYLHHDCSPRIIHRDVKSSNILLDKAFQAHLTDFGIAKSLCTSKTFTSTNIMGTIGYIDPEYAQTSRLTEKSDVYSYGIVLLELLTRRKAVDNESNLHHQVESKAAINEVMETVDPEISATCNYPNEVKDIFQLALLCTKRQPSERPTMHEIVRVLASQPTTNNA